MLYNSLWSFVFQSSPKVCLECSQNGPKLLRTTAAVTVFFLSATKCSKPIPAWLTSERKTGKLYVRLTSPPQIECSS